jgi:ADP-ribosylglycohydrolase
MKFNSILMTLLFLIVATYAPHTYAGDAVATMAKIVSSLQHFPNEADKEALTAIVAGDSGDSVKAVASAIAGISHKVSDSDKVILEAIAKSDTESARLRELASIVVGVNHMPSSSAQSALAALSN